MSSQPEQPVRVGSGMSGDLAPGSWQRLLALSGVAFAVLFVVGWFASGGDAPDYGASDQDWVNWADDNQWKSRIGAFAMLLAGFVFLHFAATIRTALGSAETNVRGVAQLARVAFAGAITGMAGMTMAIVIISSATTEGADTNPVVTRAVSFLVAFATLLAGLGEDSIFGFGFFPGVLALVIWSIATSIATYRLAQ